MQATLFLPVYLKDRLPPTHYKQFCNLVETISLTTENTLEVIDKSKLFRIEHVTDFAKNNNVKVSDIAVIRQRLISFYRYYEQTFYGYKWQQIAACLPVFHQLLHVADFLEDLGK